MHPHVDGTLLVMLAAILVTFQRIGLAIRIGGIGVWWAAPYM